MKKLLNRIWIILLLFSVNLAFSQSEKTAKALDFEYKETDLLPGHTIEQKLSHVSQIDKLEYTKNDYARCSASACLNAYLVMNGDWPGLISKYGLNQDLSFKNIHQLQDTLVILAESDDRPGIYGSFKPKWDDRGKLESWYMPEDVELPYILDAMDFKYEPLLGPKKDAEYQKKKKVLQFFKNNPNGVILMGVHEDMEAWKSKPIGEGAPGNHYIICFKRGKDFHFLDTWRKPGMLSNGIFSKEEVKTMLFETRNMLVGLVFK